MDRACPIERPSASAFYAAWLESRRWWGAELAAAPECLDHNSQCPYWAAIGECQSNPGFMLNNCPVTCKMCQSETCKDELDDCAERSRGGPRP